METAEFRKENGATREIRVVVLTANGHTLWAIRKLLKQTSDGLHRQVGMILVETDVILTKWESADNEEMLTQVVKRMESYEKPYDVAVGFRDFTFPQVLQYYLLGIQEGAMDDIYRRFIVIRKMNAEVLMHELCHGFIFSRAHSRGLMSSIAFYIVPGVLSLNRSVYLANDDRKEIITNKWRDFSITPAACLTPQDR